MMQDILTVDQHFEVQLLEEDLNRSLSAGGLEETSPKPQNPIIKYEYDLEYLRGI
jgi:hypothetical protein